MPGISFDRALDYYAATRGYPPGVAERLRANLFNVRTRVVEGIPADQIIYVAQTEHADLIVMATHGRTGLGLALCRRLTHLLGGGCLNAGRLKVQAFECSRYTGFSLRIRAKTPASLKVNRNVFRSSIACDVDRKLSLLSIHRFPTAQTHGSIP